jgi:hypothetical protein
MRVKWWVGFVTIAVAAPFGAHADNRATQFSSDFWYNSQSRGQSQLMRVPVAVDSQSDATASVLREPAAIRPIDTYMDTYMRRGFEASPTVRGGGSAAAVPRVVPATTPHVTAAPAPTAAPEMNAGLAAAGLTLLFGGVAILRGRRSRPNV